MALVCMADAHECVSRFLIQMGLRPRTSLKPQGYTLRMSEGLLNKELDKLGKGQPESWPKKLPPAKP